MRQDVCEQTRKVTFMCKVIGKRRVGQFEANADGPNYFVIALIVAYVVFEVSSLSICCSQIKRFK